MTVFQTIATLLVFAALGAYVNQRLLRLPAAIGLMFFALVLSLVATGLAHIGLIDLDRVSAFVAGIDFSGLLLHGMLSFLLFAGAMHVDLGELKKYRVIVAVLATIGVVIATFVTGTLVWLAAKILGFPFPYIYALLFGALIAPTDPVAVLSILKETGISRTLRVKIASESLLNDGVGVVIFLVILGIATSPSAARIDVYNIGLLLAWQGIGGFALGLALGWLTYLLLHSIDDYKIEVLLTMALAAGGYALAEFVDVSAPIAMVVAGLVLGTQGEFFGLTTKMRKHLDMFWELLDETLNAVLFMLIGLEMMVITITAPHLAAGLAAIIAVLAGRLISVGAPVFLMRMLHYRFEPGTIRLLTWGGLRGGISIAMALSLPPGPEKEIILGMTYLVVVFSVLFQGTTFRHVVGMIAGRKSARARFLTRLAPRAYNRSMKKTFLALLTFVCLAACSSGQPAPVKFSAPPSSKIVLDVAAINIVDHSAFQPSTSPYNSHRLEPTIAAAVHQWLADNVQAGGTQGQALIVIKDGSLSSETLPISQDLADKWFERQQGSKYTGHTEVSMEIQGRDTYAMASAEATHSVTLFENPTELERQNQYAILLSALMKDFARNFDAGVREHMGEYVQAGR